MLPDLWKPDLTIVFVGLAVDDLSDTLGFPHLQPKNRFWEMLVVGGITPKRVITTQEAKALADGHKRGSLTDPVRAMFIEKKSDQLLRLGIGLTYLNRRVVVHSEKDAEAKPTDADVSTFLGDVETHTPKILAFVISPDIFAATLRKRYPAVTETMGVQPFAINTAEVWLLGSPMSRLREELLTQQEDTFFALGERCQSLGGL